MTMKVSLRELEYEGTRYYKLFGTPERAARTLFAIKCGEKSCKGCPIDEPCAECDVKALLEWLEEADE